MQTWGKEDSDTSGSVTEDILKEVWGEIKSVKITWRFKEERTVMVQEKEQPETGKCLQIEGKEGKSLNGKQVIDRVETEEGFNNISQGRVSFSRHDSEVLSWELILSQDHMLMNG